MSRSFAGAIRLALLASSSLSLALPAVAAPQIFTTPNIVTTAGSTTVTLGGQSFVNSGLVGAGRLPSNLVDFNGDTFGAFSSMAFDLSTWRRTATGYSATLFALPDRGPNDPASQSFSDYPGRLNRFNLTFAPYTGTANLPAATTSQNQVALTQAGGFLLRDFTGSVTTGKDPGVGGTVTKGGFVLPGPTAGPGAGKISLDAEGIAFLRDGSFYVSDEYGAAVYYFTAAGQMTGAILPPGAVLPRDAAGAPQFSSITQSATGRRVNQGLEGMAVTPDGRKLVTLLQSAAVQDSTAAQQTRTNTRLMIYDIATTKTPTAPVGHYILQLPIFTQNGDGAPANRTAAQSEMLALNDTQFLVLSRDGIGLGAPGGPASPVFKSVLLVDIAGATNIAGTTFETTATPVAPGGNLVSTVTPVQQVQLVNILNTTQLTKFGFNTNNAPANRLTLSEKLEGMALAPVLDDAAPQDFFLFVGNDNDFISTQCTTGGTNCSNTFDNDAIMLVYRLTLPTYVDPQYRQAMVDGGPVMLESTAQAGLAVAKGGQGETMAHMNAWRRAGLSSEGLSAWANASYRDEDWDDYLAPGTPAKGKAFRGTLGVDYGVDDTSTFGVTLGYGDAEIEPGAGFAASADGFTIGGTYRFTGPDLPFVNAGYAYSDIDGTDLTRPAAYGLTATGETGGTAHAAFAEVGYSFAFDRVTASPIAAYRYARADFDAYTETGAAGGNVAMPEFKRRSGVVSVGGEVVYAMDDVMPMIHAAYNIETADAARAATLKLASATAAIASETVTVPTVNEDFISAGVGLQGAFGRGVWQVGYSAEFGRDDRFSHALRAGVGLRF